MREADSEKASKFYMYKFRTKFCSMRGNCRRRGTCSDAHSKITKRRVPALDEKHRKWNYIPKPCPQYRRSNSCSLGDSCPRSHGWLEVIYHPLIYKTKLCKSKCKKGKCARYGLYCAKAHSRFEVRNLVDIFGYDWSRYYDLSNRLGFEPKDSSFESKVKAKRKKFHSSRVGLAQIPNTYQALDIDFFATYLLEKGKGASIKDRPGKHEQNIHPNAIYNSHIMYDDFGHLDTYALGRNTPIQDSPFSSTSEFVITPLPEKLEDGGGHSQNIWDQGYSPEEECMSLSIENKTQVLTDISIPIQYDCESLSLSDTDWLMFYETASLQSDKQHVMSGLSGLYSDGSDRSEYNYDRMPQNWFESTCLEKGSELFTNRMA